MNYEVVLYFAGPKTLFSGRISEDEIILRRSCPWRWLARKIARNLHSQLDPARVGWAVLKDGEAVEHVEALVAEPAGPPPLAAQVEENRRANAEQAMTDRVVADLKRNHRIH